MGDHGRIDRVGLGEFAHGFGEVAHLAGIDNGDRNPGGDQGGPASQRRHAARRRGMMDVMLTQEEAGKLVAAPESERLERKRAFSNAESIREAICAFANDMPRSFESGFVLIGVEDDGQLARLPITDDLLLRLSALRDVALFLL